MTRRIRLLGFGWAWGVAALWLIRHPPDLELVRQEVQGIREHWAGWQPGAMAARHLVTLRALGVVVCMAAACRQAGRMFLAWCGADRHGRRPARWLPALPAGWGMAGSIGFGVAACGLFRVDVLGVLVFGGAVTGARPLYAVTRSAFREARNCWGPAGWAGRACAVLVAILGAGHVVASLAPETGVDSLIHHLAIAARTLALGRLVPMPQNAPSHVSALSEMLRAAALGLGGEPAARLLGPVATAVTVLWLVTGVRARSGAGWGWCAAALFLTAEPVIQFGTGCKPDGLLAPCVLGALVLLGREGPWRSAGRAVAAGWLLGTAASMKYLAGGTGLAVVAAALAGRSPVAVVAGLLAGLAAPVMSWLVKSWLLTGNPVYPAGYAWFGGLELTPAAASNLMRELATLTHHAAYATARERLDAPWTITMVDGAPPGWLALLPLALLVRTKRRAWRWPGAAAVALAVWAMGPVQARYLIPLLPVLAWLAVEAMVATPRGGAAVAAALILIQLPHTLALPDLAGSVPCGLGWEDREVCFRRRLPPYAEVLTALRALPERSRVLCIGSDAAYPLIRPLLVSSRWQAQPMYALIRASTRPEELWRAMRQRGITHVLYNPVAAIYQRRLQAAHPWAAGDVAVWEAVWRGHAREIVRTGQKSERQGWFMLYAVEARPATPPGYAYLPGLEGMLAGVERDVGAFGVEAGLREYRALPPAARRYGALRHFHARLLRAIHPREALAELVAAERTGYRDVALYQDEIDLGDRLGERDLATAARRALRAAGATP